MNLPPNQVLVGLVLFYHSLRCSLFWAAKERCVGSDDKRENNGKQAAETTAPIMKEYMSKHTYKHDLK